LSCTHGLWDEPEIYDKTAWLPHLAEKLQVFKKLREVHISNWAYADDDLRHLKNIPQLASFANDSAFGKAEPFTGSGLKHLVMPGELRRLSLGGDGITDDSLAHVGRLTALEQLWIYGPHVSGDGLRHLARLDLRELSLRTKRPLGAGLQHLAAMHKMQKLTLPHNQITDDPLRHLAAMQELTELDLQDNCLTGEGLAPLGKLKSLKKLLLSNNDIAGDATQHLSPLSQLELLTLHDNERLGDDALPPLAELPALVEVTLGGKVTIDALRRFRQLRPQVKLSFDPRAAFGLREHWHVKLDDDWRIQSVSFNKATDDDLAQFATRKELADVESISFPFPQRITGPGLVHLQSHTKVVRLHLDQCNIGVAGLQAIGHLKQLEQLEIDEGDIALKGLVHLGRLTELRELTITGSVLTDDDLSFLQNLTKLESLSLPGYRVTPTGIAKWLPEGNQLMRLTLSSRIYEGDGVITGEALRRIIEAARSDP
jgi:Leucine-rich repeat (LRR) protein